MNTTRPVTPIGILAASLQSLQRQVGESLPATAQAELSRAVELAEGIEPYLENMTDEASVTQKELAQATLQQNWREVFEDGETLAALEAEMLSGRVEANLLKMLISMTNARSVLEVGMFTGYAALAMADALPQDGRIISCEIDPYVARFAQSFFDKSPNGSKIEVRLGPALDTIKGLIGHSTFDFVFIDADKQGYKEYFDTIVSNNLLRPGGLIAVDNTLYQGEVYNSKRDPSANGKAIRHFNEHAKNTPGFSSIVLPLRDGVSLFLRDKEI